MSCTIVYDMSHIAQRLNRVLLPVPPTRRGRRVFNLGVGLVLFGVSIGLMLSAGLGVPAWDVLHQGLALRSGMTFGWTVVGVSIAALVIWIPLRQRPGVGTLANAIVVGMSADLTLLILPPVGEPAAQAALLVVGVFTNGVATGLYIGAGLGPGPRDGLMTGLAERTSRSMRLVRTLIEVTVLALGWALGGPVGVGTVLYAFAIGPLSQQFIATFHVEPSTGAADRRTSLASPTPTARSSR